VEKENLQEEIARLNDALLDSSSKQGLLEREANAARRIELTSQVKHLTVQLAQVMAVGKEQGVSIMLDNLQQQAETLAIDVRNGSDKDETLAVAMDALEEGIDSGIKANQEHQVMEAQMVHALEDTARAKEALAAAEKLLTVAATQNGAPGMLKKRAKWGGSTGMETRMQEMELELAQAQRKGARDVLEANRNVAAFEAQICDLQSKLVDERKKVMLMNKAMAEVNQAHVDKESAQVTLESAARKVMAIAADEHTEGLIDRDIETLAKTQPLSPYVHETSESGVVNRIISDQKRNVIRNSSEFAVDSVMMQDEAPYMEEGVHFSEVASQDANDGSGFSSGYATRRSGFETARNSVVDMELSLAMKSPSLLDRVNSIMFGGSNSKPSTEQPGRAQLARKNQGELDAIYHSARAKALKDVGQAGVAGNQAPEALIDSVEREVKDQMHSHEDALLRRAHLLPRNAGNAKSTAWRKEDNENQYRGMVLESKPELRDDALLERAMMAQSHSSNSTSIGARVNRVTTRAQTARDQGDRLVRRMELEEPIYDGSLLKRVTSSSNSVTSRSAPETLVRQLSEHEHTALFDVGPRWDTSTGLGNSQQNQRWDQSNQMEAYSPAGLVRNRMQDQFAMRESSDGGLVRGTLKETFDLMENRHIEIDEVGLQSRFHDGSTKAASQDASQDASILQRLNASQTDATSNAMLARASHLMGLDDAPNSGGGGSLRPPPGTVGSRGRLR